MTNTTRILTTVITAAAIALPIHHYSVEVRDEEPTQQAQQVQTFTEVMPTATIAPAPDQERCEEDMDCWNWRTMGNHSRSGSMYTLDEDGSYDDTWTGVITDNQDGTFTFTPDN